MSLWHVILAVVMKKFKIYKNRRNYSYYIFIRNCKDKEYQTIYISMRMLKSNALYNLFYFSLFQYYEDNIIFDRTGNKFSVFFPNNQENYKIILY